MELEIERELEQAGYGNLHKLDRCRGQTCMIHNPTQHHMLRWPVDLRLDKGMAERKCQHGIGHPDPDSYEFVARAAGKDQADALAVHGCDGCCHVKPF